MLRYQVLLATLLAVCALPSFSQPLFDRARLAQLDAHALAAPSEVEQSFEKLAHYLTAPARNDAEKLRLIYRWITDRITYDVDTYLGKSAPDPLSLSPEGVLASRTSICEGYASVFERLGSLAGLDVKTVRGYAKAYGGTAADVNAPNHAWTAVRLDGSWYLLDSTWGAGRVEADRYQKSFSERYFLAPAEQMIFTHFPEDERWQLQSTGRVSRAEFDALPQLGAAFFNLGFKGEEVWKTLQASQFKAPVVRTFDLPWHMVEVAAAPLAYELEQNQAYEYRIRTTAFETMAVIHNQTWNYMEREGDTFVLRFAPKSSGEVHIAAKPMASENFTIILAYKAN